ncbi:unnamed protein product [Staurois parvus]|uniref:Uncharacterized protein n=1 Tax=Staurois parvus TaxID=386267 RepID=A0ABN9GD46_9NEOB|nr:unnamed protein product [Staurois parvus]
MYVKKKVFKIFKFAAGSGPHTSRRHRDWNTEARCRASAGGDGRGRCRRDIAAAKDKGSAAGNP